MKAREVEQVRTIQTEEIVTTHVSFDNTYVFVRKLRETIAQPGFLLRLQQVLRRVHFHEEPVRQDGVVQFLVEWEEEIHPVPDEDGPHVEVVCHGLLHEKQCVTRTEHRQQRPEWETCLRGLEGRKKK